MLVCLYKIYKGDWMKTALAIIGILIFLIYISPLYKSKLNLGNIFGMIFGSALIVCSVFFEQICDLYNRTFGKVLIILFITAVIIFFILFFSTLFQIIKAIMCNAKNEQTVIVLGCRVKGETPSKALIKRCQAAEKYMKSNRNATAILSGGQGEDENISEAECMYHLLIKSGIDSKRLIKEEKSTSTYENFLYSNKIIIERDLSKNIAIATSEYHIFRAKLYANKLDLKASSLPAKSIPVLRVPYFTREIFAVWALKLKEHFAKSGFVNKSV